MKAENYFKSALKENRPSLKKQPPLFDFCRFFPLLKGEKAAKS